MQKVHALIGVALLLGLVTACQKQEISANDSSVILEKNLTDIRNYAVSKGFSGTLTGSGLYYYTTKANPTGKPAAYGDELEFNYKLYVLSGVSNATVASGSSSTVVTDQVVDTAFTTTPVYFTFFPNSLLYGLEQGILLTREGEQATLLIPSDLAFGNQASNNNLIPANSPVRFDLTFRRSRTEDQQIDEYIAGNKLTVTERTTSGLRFIKTGENPTGAVPSAGQTLTIKYRGTRLRGTTAFDSTGTGTADFTLGGNYIKGFNEGLYKLKVGEKATLIFPSALGYGTTGSQRGNVYVIPPYSPLRFDIEVISAK